MKEKKETQPNQKTLGHKLDLDEKSRTYIFPNKNELTIEEAIVLYVNNMGTHKLINKKGEIYIVPQQWLGLKIIEYEK